MEDRVKNRIIIALGIFSAILLISTVSSCNGLRSKEQKWRKEMAQRLDSEEKMQKAVQEQAVLAEQVDKTGKTLQESAKELETTKRLLLQEQMVNQNLKAEIVKLGKLREALEEDLKEALVAGGKQAAKKQPKK